MAVFLSTFVNRIDRKGRVSVPAAFRAALGNDAANGIIIFRSLQHEALEACSQTHLEKLSNSLEKLDLTPETYELVETTIFGGSVLVPMDAEGRIGLPDEMAQAVGISEAIAFVGRRNTFQLWEPGRLAAHESQARAKARAQDISLAKIIASAARGGS